LKKNERTKTRSSIAAITNGMPGHEQIAWGRKGLEMFKKKIEKKTSELPAPPEPEFYDEPKGREKAVGFVQDSLEKWWVRLVLAFFAVLILSVIVFHGPSKKKTTAYPSVGTEQRIVVTTQSMERAIDSSLKGKKVTMRQNVDQRTIAKKRKYDTNIAVFVTKPESVKESAFSRNQNKEKIKLGLSSGTKIHALLTDRIFSFNVAAPVTAVLPKDFILKDKIVIPKDSMFLGEVNVLKSIDRINVRFDLLILPDGRELRIQAIALSEDGSSGIKGKVDKHTDTKVLKTIGETLLAGASLFVGGRNQDPYSLEDQMRVNLSENLANQASQDLRSVKVDKSITVESGIRIWVMLLETI